VADPLSNPLISKAKVLKFSARYARRIVKLDLKASLRSVASKVLCLAASSLQSIIATWI